jgi:eukaryotic-like serine/threonine-protein kinase
VVPRYSKHLKDIATEVADTRLDFLSHEAISGELLSTELARGPLPAEEALRIAIEIGAALHKIHSRGLVHGALSAGCIVLGAGGARILHGSPSPEDRAPYRAPEQIRGEEPDVRSDVFAYGALLYEMVAGKRPFPGVGAELNQNILTLAPLPLTADSPISAALQVVVAGCLEKEPALRRQRVQNAVIELKLAGRSATRAVNGIRRMPLRASVVPVPPAASLPPPAPRPNLPPPGISSAIQRATPPFAAGRPFEAPIGARGRTLYGLSLNRQFWMIGGGLLVLAATSVAAVLFLQQRPAPVVLKFAVTQPENTSYPGMPSVSPDGRYLTFSAVGPEGKRMLWLRPLDALHATVIQGSEGASAPFWSPDSQAIAFFGGRFLKKVRIAGGTPENICQADAAPGGGS